MTKTNTASGHDVVIKDGLVFDGTGAPRLRADVAVSDGRVTAIGQVDARDAAKVIDATGMHVVPGFVDLHTHYDAQVFWDPYRTL
jgi:N-acyl-D-aspartate/D-glutamate deacylase